MITVKVLGSGCPNCKRLEQVARNAAEHNSIKAEFIKVTSMNDIMAYPILSTPALVINEKVVSFGRIPAEEEIAGWLAEAV